MIGREARRSSNPKQRVFCMYVSDGDGNRRGLLNESEPPPGKDGRRETKGWKHGGRSGRSDASEVEEEFFATNASDGDRNSSKYLYEWFDSEDDDAEGWGSRKPTGEAKTNDGSDETLLSKSLSD